MNKGGGTVEIVDAYSGEVVLRLRPGDRVALIQIKRNLFILGKKKKA